MISFMKFWEIGFFLCLSGESLNFRILLLTPKFRSDPPSCPGCLLFYWFTPRICFLYISATEIWFYGLYCFPLRLSVPYLFSSPVWCTSVSAIPKFEAVLDGINLSVFLSFLFFEDVKPYKHSFYLSSSIIENPISSSIGLNDEY